MSDRVDYPLFNALIIDRTGANRAARPRDESLVVEADKYVLAIDKGVHQDRTASGLPRAAQQSGHETSVQGHSGHIEPAPVTSAVPLTADIHLRRNICRSGRRTTVWAAGKDRCRLRRSVASAPAIVA